MLVWLSMASQSATTLAVLPRWQWASTGMALAALLTAGAGLALAADAFGLRVFVFSMDMTSAMDQLATEWNDVSNAAHRHSALGRGAHRLLCLSSVSLFFLLIFYDSTFVSLW